jgi:hypothetical protein
MVIAVLLCAGSVQGLVIAKNLLPSLALPLDGSRTFRGHRLFGANKTVRGALVMISATAVASALLFPLVPPFSSPPAVGWAGLGALMGLAYIMAELPNSFVKRQISIEPGAKTTGPGRVVQYVIDEADSGAELPHGGVPIQPDKHGRTVGSADRLHPLGRGAQDQTRRAEPYSMKRSKTVRIAPVTAASGWNSTSPSASPQTNPTGKPRRS